MENHINPSSFRDQGNELRRSLRFGDHHFEHDQLNSVGDLLERTAEHLGEEHTAKNHEKAMEFIKKQPEWKRLAPGKQEALHLAIKGHLGIAEETAH